MDAEKFCYWLQGYAEICGDCPNDVAWEIIKDHLQLVFNKVTPDRNPVPTTVDDVFKDWNDQWKPTPYEPPSIFTKEWNPPIATC